MIERLLEPGFWVKCSAVILLVGLTLMVFSAVFDPTTEFTIPGGRVFMAIIGILFGAFATYFYQAELY